MSFWGKARVAAADQYGRENYRRYARRARLGQFLAWVGLLAALVFFYLIGHR